MISSIVEQNQKQEMTMSHSENSEEVKKLMPKEITDGTKLISSAVSLQK
jgi:phosphoribosylformylglycinamidine (FGAM) synthase-like amidotransferase family enzyme